MLGELLRRNPDMIDSLGDPDALRLRSRDELVSGTRAALEWRAEDVERWLALKRFTDREGLRIAAHDVFDLIDVHEVEVALTNLAEATLEAALAVLEPPLPFAVISLGRLGGAELSYASDLDVVFVYDGSTATDFAHAERVATTLLSSIGGNRPHVYDIDADLRPEGKDGPLARRLEGYREYFERWAEPWERLAMVRARPVAGDVDLANRFMHVRERVRLGRTADRRRSTCHPPHQGAGRERAHPDQRGSSVPLEARSWHVVGRRVLRAVAPTRQRDQRTGDDGRARQRSRPLTP